MQSPSQDAVQARVREWLRRVLAAKGWSEHRLAKEAGVSPATIHRALYDDRFVTSSLTLEKVAGAAGVPSPLAPPVGGGFREPDALFVADGATKSFGMDADGPQAVWRLSTRACELAGFLPGDLVLMDERLTPKAGDLVCAQVYDLARDSAETVFRIYDPPYLAARTMDPAISSKPLLVDGERVRIAAVMVKMLRERGP